DGANFVDAGREHSVSFAGGAAFGGVAAVGAAGAGSVTLKGDLNEASIGTGALVTAPDGVDVRATTNHDFHNLAIGGSLGLIFGGGLAAGFNFTASEARAEVDGTVDAGSKDLNVIATTDETYGSPIGVGGLYGAVGSIEANIIGNTTHAGINAQPKPLQATFNAKTAVDSAEDTIALTGSNPFHSGDAVVYRNNDDNSNIGDLVDGLTYFVSVDAGNPALIRLHHTRADALAGTNAIHLAPVTAALDNHSLVAEHTIDPATAVDGMADTIKIGNFAGLADGDAVTYFNGR